MHHRRSAAEARSAIRAAALEEFALHGYERTSLEGIAGRVDVTRQAVLYHFGSKEELLRAVVEPAFETLRAAVNQAEMGDPPTRAERRRLLTALVDALCDHRRAMAVTARLTDHAHLPDMVPELGEINHAIRRLLGGSRVDSDPALRARVIAAMAALSAIWGARFDDVPISSPTQRRALVEGCLAMLGTGKSSTVA